MAHLLSVCVRITQVQSYLHATYSGRIFGCIIEHECYGNDSKDSCINPNDITSVIMLVVKVQSNHPKLMLEIEVTYSLSLNTQHYIIIFWEAIELHGV